MVVAVDVDEEMKTRSCDKEYQEWRVACGGAKLASWLPDKSAQNTQSKAPQS